MQTVVIHTPRRITKLLRGVALLLAWQSAGAEENVSQLLQEGFCKQDLCPDQVVERTDDVHIYGEAGCPSPPPQFGKPVPPSNEQVDACAKTAKEMAERIKQRLTEKACKEAMDIVNQLANLSFCPAGCSDEGLTKAEGCSTLDDPPVESNCSDESEEWNTLCLLYAQFNYYPGAASGSEILSNYCKEKKDDPSYFYCFAKIGQKVTARAARSCDLPAAGMCSPVSVFQSFEIND